MFPEQSRRFCIGKQKSSEGDHMRLAGIFLILMPFFAEAKRPLQELNPIDQYFESYWKAEKIKPAPLTDDYEYLRRVTLDLGGPMAPDSLPVPLLRNRSDQSLLSLLRRMAQRVVPERSSVQPIRHATDRRAENSQPEEGLLRSTTAPGGRRI